jgi:serine/threonine protein kinase
MITALSELEEKKIAHRDIKPGNIIIFENNISPYY